MLDAVVRRQERWRGAWRQRLALSAAAAAVRQAGRIGDEAALRDAVLLTRPGDDPGPAGRIALAWRRLATRPAGELLTKASLGAVLDDLGHGGDGEAVAALADEARRLHAGEGLTGMLAGAFLAAERHGFDRVAGAWLADALLAQRLGWDRAVPLLGAEVAGLRPRRSPALSDMTRDEEATKRLASVQVRAALDAIDLSAALGRRAQRLVAVAPKLRAKGAAAVVGRLLDEDALIASRGEQMAGISDRGLRRLFDRLTDLDAVRELTGRPTFRIYGL
jgi:hypothetical protein